MCGLGGGDKAHVYNPLFEKVALGVSTGFFSFELEY